MQSNRQFFGGLESLRGIAALLVVLCHMPAYWQVPVLKTCFMGNGYLMVDLFFVLSGFVICHSYGGGELTTTRGIGRFMVIRFGRLYPLHLYMLVVFLGIETAKYMAEVKWGFRARETRAFSFSNTPAFIANLFLMQPFFQATNKSFNHPSWSIGVEFYTYLIFGWVCLLLPKKKWLTPVASGLAVAALAGLWLGGERYLSASAAFCFLRCVLGFFLGVACHELYAQRPGWLSRRDWRIEAVLLAVVIGVLASKPRETGWDFVLPPLFAMLVFSVAGAAGGVWYWYPLRWLGKISYSVYMVHMAVLMAMGRLLVPVDHRLLKLFPRAGTTIVWVMEWVFILGSLTLVFGCSQCLFLWIEVPYQKHFRRLADSWFARPVVKTIPVPLAGEPSA